MSEYVYAELHEDSEKVELRWLYNDVKYGIVIGQELFDQLEVEAGQKTPVVMELLVFDAETEGIDNE